MAVPLIHRCGHCGYESEISSSLSPFAENPFCRQCGLSASESDSKLQDELSNLINQHLTLSQPTMAEKQVSPISPITYITQHYHHSGHVAPVPTQQLEDANQQLASNGIDVNLLSPSQLRLFVNAQQDQQARLIELWRLAPPTPQERDGGNWPTTTMEQEEQAARARYMKLASPITLDQSMDYMQVHQQPDPNATHQNAEPYMVHGYTSAGQNPYSPSLDPAYQQQGGNQDASREWWARTRSSQPMEHQYGALMQMREMYEGSLATGGGGRDENMW